MNEDDYLNEAVEMVTAWELPEDEFADAVNHQARLMAGLDLDEDLT